METIADCMILIAISIVPTSVYNPIDGIPIILVNM